VDYPTVTLEQVDGTIAFECHEEEVEQAMEEPRRAEEAYSAAHSNSPDIKENFGACVGRWRRDGPDG
jgi:hypothetical protein